MKLFAVYVGGQTPRANIELHDMRFVVATSIEETYEELRRQWWGTPSTLHIDCWADLDHADGHDIVLSPEPFLGDLKLYYVNLGGYDHLDFSEKHKNMFVVATSATEAKSRALKTVRDWQAPHRDDLYEAEQAFCLEDGVMQARLYIHLELSAQPRPLRFTCAYTPLKSATIKRAAPSS